LAIFENTRSRVRGPDVVVVPYRAGFGVRQMCLGVLIIFPKRARRRMTLLAFAAYLMRPVVFHQQGVSIGRFNHYHFHLHSSWCVGLAIGLAR